MRHFCIAGPIQSDIHYSIPPLDRLDHAQILSLIDQRKYFVMHAPRQTGKTTALLALVAELNATGRYRAIYANIEGAQAARNDVASALRAIVSVISSRAQSHLNDPFPEQIREDVLQAAGPHQALRQLLSRWSKNSPLPICVMVDEIDALVGDTLISVLRQLRGGYEERPAGFPQSLILCGVRDVRDYRLHMGGEVITGGSAFNIKAESLRLGDFSGDDIRNLYEQHSAETGQVFEESIYPLVWDLTHGQPWIVNALADRAVRIEKDRSKPITPVLILQAKEALILERVTHLDQLTDKLKEPRVRRVIEPIVTGDDPSQSTLETSDDEQYVLDLGLIRRGPNGFEIANGIYQEVIPRELNHRMQYNFEPVQRTAWYVRADGTLDMPKMLEAFQQFFRENSEIWLNRYEYQEAGPQLILQAFFQRIVNGGGRLDREYGLGRKRTDILILWNLADGTTQRIVIELKIIRNSLEKTIAEGLRQIAEYMDRAASNDAHLVLFSRSPDLSWDSKIFRREEQTPDGRPVTVWGL